MAWPTDWATGEEIVDTRLKQWTDAQKVWPGTVDANTNSVNYILRAHCSGATAEFSLANRALGSRSLVESPTGIGERWALYVAGSAGDGQLRVWSGGDLFALHPKGWMEIKNTGVPPGTNPTTAHYIYSEAGALKGRGSSGTITTIAPAEPHCPVCKSDFALEWVNKKYGHLIVCMRCWAKEHGNRRWISFKKAV